MNDSRFPPKNNPSYNGNRNQATMSSNGNYNSRNPGQNTAPPRIISRNPGVEKRMNEQPKGLSSAEFQRQQFERERQEIQLKRQNAKQTSSGGPGSIGDASSGRLPAYHDECDLLMDELAGKSNSSMNMKSTVPVQIVTAPEQPAGKSNLILGAIGLGVNDRSPQPSPQGMKKINLDNIFSKKKAVLGPPPGMTGPPPGMSGPPPGITIPQSSTLNVGMGGLNGSHTFSAVPVTLQHKDFERESDFTKEAIVDADDDYEVSMRMIDRMISGDDDYDKDDISTSYSETSVAQPASRYAFSDSHAATINQFGLQQPLGMSQSSIPSTSRSSPLCIGGDSTFSLSSMKIQGESNDSLGSMSHTPYRSGYCSPSQPQTMQSTNVLLKLGYDAQSPTRNTDKIAESVMLHLSSPATQNTSQKLTNTPSTPKQTAVAGHSSPFAFHSSSSGGGSSGGGSRRTSGGGGAHVAPSSSSPVPTSSDKGRVSLIKSNMSASSWQQLQKMARGVTPTTPRPEEDSVGTSIKSHSDDTARQSKNSTPRQPPTAVSATAAVITTTLTAAAAATVTAVAIPATVTAATVASTAVTPTSVSGFVGKDVGLHRINVSDLFKASSGSDEKGKKNVASIATST